MQPETGVGLMAKDVALTLTQSVKVNGMLRWPGYKDKDIATLADGLNPDSLSVVVFDRLETARRLDWGNHRIYLGSLKDDRRAQPGLAVVLSREGERLVVRFADSQASVR